jgi:hypothetical protein
LEFLTFDETGSGRARRRRRRLTAAAAAGEPAACARARTPRAKDLSQAMARTGRARGCQLRFSWAFSEPD